MNENPYTPPASNPDPGESEKSRREKKAYNNRMSLIIGIPGLLSQIIGNFMQNNDETSLLGTILLLVGTLVFMVGLVYYTRTKGRHPAWCLMAWFSLVGLIVLALLRDRNVIDESTEAETEESAAGTSTPTSPT